MEFLGTKGKWEIEHENKVYVGKNLIACAYGFDVKREYIYTNETKANALLISKAPEMLDMLENIFKDYDYAKNNWEKLEQLIKEATEI